MTQHSVQHLYEMLGNKKIIISNKTKNLVKELIQHYKDIQSSFYKEDLDNLLEANDNLKNLLYNKVLKEIRKSSKEESVILYYLGDMSRLSYLTTIPLIAILLE